MSDVPLVVGPPENVTEPVAYPMVSVGAPDDTETPVALPADEKPSGAFARAMRGNSTAAEGGNQFTARNDPTYWKSRKIEENSVLISTEKRKKSQPWNPDYAWKKSGAYTISEAQNAVSNTAALMRRGGMMRKRAVELQDDGKARIQIWTGTPNAPVAAVPGGLFEYFVLTGITMQDAERFDVVETFGAPHVFASGRYMRRYQFNGYLHINPLKSPTAMGRRGEASNPTVDTVPPSLVWKAFYDRYLRASTNAKNNIFVRITVPTGEVFNGYIVSASDNRDSNMEMVTAFSFMMLVVNETDDWGSNHLYNINLVPVKKTSSTVNEAELNVAIGAFTMAFSVNSNKPGDTANLDLGTVKAAEPPEAPIGTVELECSHSGYILNVTNTYRLDVFTLTYEDKTPVHGRPSRSGKNTVKVALVNYANLKEAAKALSTVDDAPARISFTVSNGSGVDASLNVTFAAEATPAVVLHGIQLVNDSSIGVWKAEKTDNGWEINIPDAEQAFSGTVLSASLDLIFAVKGTTEAVDIQATKITVDSRFLAFEGGNALSNTNMNSTVDGTNLDNCSLKTGTVSTPQHVLIPVTLTLYKAPLNGSGNVVCLFTQVDGVGGRINLSIASDSGYSLSEREGQIIIRAKMKPRAPYLGLFDLTKCKYERRTGGLWAELYTSVADLPRDFIKTYLNGASLNLVGPSVSYNITLARDGHDAFIRVSGYRMHLTVYYFTSVGRAEMSIRLEADPGTGPATPAAEAAAALALSSLSSMALVTKSGERIPIVKK